MCTSCVQPATCRHALAQAHVELGLQTSPAVKLLRRSVDKPLPAQLAQDGGSADKQGHVGSVGSSPCAVNPPESEHHPSATRHQKDKSQPVASKQCAQPSCPRKPYMVRKPPRPALTGRAAAALRQSLRVTKCPAQKVACPPQPMAAAFGLQGSCGSDVQPQQRTAVRLQIGLGGSVTKPLQPSKRTLEQRATYAVRDSSCNASIVGQSATAVAC